MGVHGSLHCCKTNRGTERTTFLSLEMQEVERRQPLMRPTLHPTPLRFLTAPIRWPDHA